MNYIDGNTLAGKRFKMLENGDLREVKRGRSVPKCGDKYYFVGDLGEVSCSVWGDDDIDHWRMKHLILLVTEEDCEECRQFIETLDKYTFEPDWNDANQEKWYFFYDHGRKVIDYDYAMSCHDKEYYFRSEDQAKAFIAEVGEDAVKRFMFDVWE